MSKFDGMLVYGPLEPGDLEAGFCPPLPINLDYRVFTRWREIEEPVVVSSNSDDWLGQYHQQAVCFTAWEIALKTMPDKPS